MFAGKALSTPPCGTLWYISPGLLNALWKLTPKRISQKKMFVSILASGETLHYAEDVYLGILSIRDSLPHLLHRGTIQGSGYCVQRCDVDKSRLLYREKCRWFRTAMTSAAWLYVLDLTLFWIKHLQRVPWNDLSVYRFQRVSHEWKRLFEDVSVFSRLFILTTVSSLLHICKQMWQAWPSYLIPPSPVAAYHTNQPSSDGTVIFVNVVCTEVYQKELQRKRPIFLTLLKYHFLQ